MTRYRFILIAAATLLAVTACTGSQSDPVAEAISQAAVKDLPGDYNFRLSSLEKIDSTTFRTEIDRRKDVFRLKKQTEENLYWKYLEEHKPKTSESHHQAMLKAARNMAVMDSIENAMAGKLDDVAYYDYVFSGSATAKEGKVSYSNVYVTITPAGEVLTMTSNQKDLHKATGRVIPGYIESITAEE